MRTYSSKSIGECLCTLAYAVVGALGTLIVAGVLAGLGWDLASAGSLVQLGVTLGGGVSLILIGSAVRRAYRGIRLSLISRRRARP